MSQLAEEMAAGEERDRRAVVETVISIVLRLGVSVSVITILAGLALLFWRHPQYASLRGGSYRRLVSPSFPFPRTPSETVAALADGGGGGMVVLGLVLLILTPVVRVAVSAYGFLYERNRRMAAVAAVVLAGLVASLVLGVVTS